MNASVTVSQLFSGSTPPVDPPSVHAMNGPMWMPMAPPTFARMLALHPQPVPVIPVLMLALAALYAAGVVLLRRRGTVGR
jgi:hypothetical protein